MEGKEKELGELEYGAWLSAFPVRSLGLIVFVGDEHKMEELGREGGLWGSKVRDDAGAESSQDSLRLGRKEFELSLKNTLSSGLKLAEGHEGEDSGQRHGKVSLDGDLVVSSNSGAQNENMGVVGLDDEDGRQLMGRGSTRNLERDCFGSQVMVRAYGKR